MTPAPNVITPFEWILIAGNLGWFLFFSGFYFGQFKQLRLDVRSIRDSVKEIERSYEKNSQDIAYIKGRLKAS